MKTRFLIALAGVMLLLAGSTLSDGASRAAQLYTIQDTPEVSAVSPDQIYSFQASTLSISGAALTGVTTVTLGVMPLWSVQIISDSQLTAQVPDGTPPGVYDIAVAAADGTSATLRDAFTVLPDSDERVGAWRSMASLNVARGGLNTVAVGDYIYAIGGGSPPTDAFAVEFSRINPDGSLQPWQLTSPLLEPAAGKTLYANGYIYVVKDHVQRAAVNDDGSLGAWEVLPGSSPPNTSPAGLVAAADNLYAVTVVPNPEPDFDDTAVVNAAPLQPDGTVGPWSMVDAWDRGVGTYETDRAGSFLYDAGGICPCPGHDPVEFVGVTAIGGNGGFFNRRSLQNLPHPRAGNLTVAGGGYLYTLGGQATDDYSDDNQQRVQRAPIRSDGTIGAWQLLPSLPDGSSVLAAELTHGFFYVFTGGTTIERAGVGAIGPLSLSQRTFSAAGGTLVISATNFLPSSAVSLDDVPLEASFGSTRTLTAAIPAGLATGRYTLTVVNPDRRGGQSHNTIVIDGENPVGSIIVGSGATYTSALTVRLTLSATDSLSGLSGMAFSNDGVAFSAEQPFATSAYWSVPAGDGEKTVYARFTDKVGNISAVVSDSMLLDQTAPSGSVTINSGASYATSYSVTLSIAASDVGAGVTEIEVDDAYHRGVWTSFAMTYPWTLNYRNGNIAVNVHFRDAVGNVSTTYSDTIILDTGPPVAAVGALSRFQHEASFPVHWSAHDNASGISSYDVQVRSGTGDWADWQSANATTSAVYTGLEGQDYWFRVRARDNAGNLSAYSSSSTQTTVDTTAPTAGSITSNGGALTSTSPDILLDLAASDANSGVSEVSFANERPSGWSAWQVYDTSKQWNMIAGSGLRTVYARFRDRAGNISMPVSDTIVLDNSIDESFAVSINDGARFTNRPDVLLTLGAVPHTAQLQVSNDGGFTGATWEPYSGHRSWSITTQGSYFIPRIVYVRYRVADGGGTSATVQDDIILDMTPPTGSVSIVDTVVAGINAADATTTTVQLRLAATDDVSDVGAMLLSNHADLSNGTWEPYATSRSWILSSNRTVYVRYRDNAFNVSTTYSATLVTSTSTPSPTRSATRTPTKTPTRQLSSTPTRTHTASPTRTRVIPATRTATRTRTPAAATRTVTKTPTHTVQPTRTRTRTRTAVGATKTTTFTTTVTLTRTPTRTPTLTRMATNTSTAIRTRTATKTRTATRTVTNTIPLTRTPRATGTLTPITFSDVAPADYFYVPVQYLAAHSVISGYGDGTFRPFNNTTRAQMMKIIVLARGWDVREPGDASFSDVPRDNPFYKFIETAVDYHIVGGNADGTFHPYANVTRGQLSKIVVLAMGWQLQTPLDPTFTDVPIDNPFYQHIETAAAHGIINGYADHKFGWQNSATRGQIAKIVYFAVIK